MTYVFGGSYGKEFKIEFVFVFEAGGGGEKKGSLVPPVFLKFFFVGFLVLVFLGGHLFSNNDFHNTLSLAMSYHTFKVSEE